MRRAAAMLALAALPLAGCGYTYVREQCPGCVVFERGIPPAPVAAGTKSLVVIVPGLLGYGWEWDEPQELLRAHPEIAVQAFQWSPWSSAERVAGDLADALDRVLADPAAPAELCVLGHSAGGIVTALVAARLAVPPGKRVRVINIGAPYGGMHTTPFDSAPDQRGALFGLALGGVFLRYPAPAARVTVESFVTGWPPDPVMKPRFGWDPGAATIGPPGPRHRVPPGTDHNHVLAWVIRRLFPGGPAPR